MTPLYENRMRMNTLVKHLPSGEVFANRKEAKLKLGHSNYNKALKNGEIAFVTVFKALDTII